MAGIDDAMWRLADVLSSIRPSAPAGRVRARCVRTDPDGTAWLSAQGNPEPIPVAGGAVSYGEGDEVEVGVGAVPSVVSNVSSPSSTVRDVSMLLRPVSKAAESAAEIASAIGQHFWADDGGAHVSTEEDNALGERNILMNSLGILLRRGAMFLASFSDSAVAFYDGQGNESENVVAQFGADGSRVGVDPTWQTVATYFEQDGMKVRTRNGYSPFTLYDLAGIVATGGEVKQGTGHGFGKDWTYDLDFTPATGTDVVLSASPGGYIGTFVAGTSDDIGTLSGTFSYDGDRTLSFVKAPHATSRGYVYVTYRKYDTADNPTLFVGEVSKAVLRAARTASVGLSLLAQTENQLVTGKYNDNQSTSAFEVGNGTGDNARSNAFAVDWSGNVVAAGGITLGTPIDSSQLDTVSRDKGGTGVTGMQTGTMTINTTNCTLNTDYNRAWSNGVVATVQLGMFTLNSALSNGGSVAVGTVPDGYRPAGRIYASVGCALAGVTGLLVAYVGTDGTITLVNRSGASLSTSVGIIITATYAI